MSGSGDDPHRTLRGIVGPDHVRPGDGSEPAGDRWAVDGRFPRVVVFPGTVDEVAACLAAARARGWAVVPAGLGVRLGWGGPPERLDVVLSLARLDRVLAHEPADLTLSAQAGLSLGALNARLREHGQFLPLDPPEAGRSTLGGLVATAASGPYRARYGTMRDLLLGVSVVRADGTLVKGGGRVVKNVTGYDVPKLHVGALGTLGVVVECHLRLHPRPAEERSWLFTFRSPEAALEAAGAIRDTPVVASRLELLDGGALAALEVGGEGGAGLAVSVGSVPEAVRAQGARIAEAGRAAGGEEVPLPADADGWWVRVSGLAWPPSGAPGATAVVLRLGTRPTDVAKALRVVAAAVDGAVGHATAELANGVARVGLAVAEPRRFADQLARIRAGLDPLPGTCVVEHAAPAVKAGLDVWGDVGPALAPMRRLKGELDPDRVLSPGRFVGGL